MRVKTKEKERVRKDKTEAILDVLKYMCKTKKYVSAYDGDILERTGRSTRRTQDILEWIYNYFNDAIERKIENKKFYYKVVNSEELLFEVLTKVDDIRWIVQDILQNTSSKYLRQIDRETRKRIKNIAKEDENVFIFKNSIMEALENSELLSRLKKAIKDRRYITIVYDERNYVKTYREIKPLKLLFVDNNWYLIAVNGDELRFFRISFIKKLRDYSKKTFILRGMERYLEFLENDVQNSLTLFGVPRRRAIIKASPRVARYFDKGMKKFLSSQTFLKKNSDGSVEFSLTYTQPLEILPLIKRWLPDLEILSPTELQLEMKKDLEKALESYKKLSNDT